VGGLSIKHPRGLPPGGKRVFVFATFGLVWTVPFDQRLAPKRTCPARAAQKYEKIIVQSQRDPIRRLQKGKKEKSSMQNNQSYDVVSCARYDKLPNNTYMVENIVIVFLLIDDSRREFLALLGNVDARFLELLCGGFECVDPTY
jgi:hypothetical protein